MDNVINENQIGRYNLPADFKYLNDNFIDELAHLDFAERIVKIYKFFTGKDLSDDALEIYDGEFPFGVVSLDEYLGVLDLTYGKTLCYEDYILDKSSPLNEIYSLASLFLSAYCELVFSGIIESGDKINFATNGDDGRLVLALYLLKKIKAPINAIMVGVTSNFNGCCKGLFVEQVTDDEINDITLGVYEEFDYLFDPISAAAMVCEDIYYDEREDDNFTLMLGLVSPFLFARKILKLITGKNELSVKNAIQMLYLETGEIPEPLLNEELSPFYKQNAPISFEDAISIING